MEDAHLMNSKSSNVRTSHRQQLWNYCIQQSIPNLTMAVSRPPPWSSDAPTFTQADTINYSSDNIETLPDTNFWNSITSQPTESSNKQSILNNFNSESIQHIRKTPGRPQVNSDSVPSHPFSLQNLTSRDDPLGFVKNLHKNQPQLPIFTAPQAHSLQHSQQMHHQISQLSPAVTLSRQESSYNSEQKYAPVNFSSSTSRKKRERNKSHIREEEEKVDIANTAISEHFYERILPVIHHNISQQQNGSSYDLSHWNLWSNQKHQVFSDQGIYSGQSVPRHGSNLVEKSTHNHQSPVVPQPELPQGPLPYFPTRHVTHHDSHPDYHKSPTSVEYCIDNKPKIITNNNKSYNSNIESERLVIVPNIEEELGFLLESAPRAIQTCTHPTADSNLNKDNSGVKNNFLGSYIKFLQEERNASLPEARTCVGPKKSTCPKSLDDVSLISSHTKAPMQSNVESKLEQKYDPQVDPRHISLLKSSEDMRKYFDNSSGLEAENDIKEFIKVPHLSVYSLENSQFQNLENTKNLENVRKKIIKKDRSLSLTETPPLPFKKDIMKQKEKQKTSVDLKREVVEEQRFFNAEPDGHPKRTKYMLENDYSINRMIKGGKNLYPNLMNTNPSNTSKMTGIEERVEKFSPKNRVVAPIRETNSSLPQGYGILELVDSNYETGDFVTLPNGIFRLSTSLEG